MFLQLLTNQRTVKPMRGSWNGMSSWLSEDALTNEMVLRLGWDFYGPIRGRFSQWEPFELDLLFAANQYLSGWPPSEANERVLKLGWALGQSEDGLTNERVVRPGWALDQSVDSLTNVNERVVTLGWALDQTVDVLTNERIVRLGWAMSYEHDILTNERVVRQVWAIDQSEDS